MKKKNFIIITLIGTFLLFSILPISNYMVDITRVLHHDYNYKYDKLNANRIFLRVLYLLDNKKKYDTLVFGSSRGEFIDTNKISAKAYNMFHGFGTLSTYLQSLKTLLANDVQVKNVWIAINDFEIWKDHSNTLHKLTYKNGLMQNLPLYTRWLFRKSSENIEVIQNSLPLVKNDFITDPTTQRIIRAYNQERKLPKKRDIPAAMLGYTGQYKIDASIRDMKEIKELCHKYNIKLTVFMYPSYYKTYLRYDQEKIDEFKIKLSSIVDFHDFYTLDKTSIDTSKWFDGSHFVPSIGDYIINNIKKGNFLITKENINTHIKQTRLRLKDMSNLPSDSIYLCQTNLDLSSYKKIFDIYDDKFTYIKNNDFSLKKNRHYFDIIVNNSDPMFILNNYKTNAKNIALDFSIDSNQKGVFQLYIKHTKDLSYHEKNTHVVKLKKGLNVFRIIIPSKFLHNGLRVDFTQNTGEYKLNKFLIRELISS